MTPTPHIDTLDAVATALDASHGSTLPTATEALDDLLVLQGACARCGVILYGREVVGFAAQLRRLAAVTSGADDEATPPGADDVDDVDPVTAVVISLDSARRRVAVDVIDGGRL